MSKRDLQDQYKKLFVGGLHINTTTESLRAYYEQFGSVNDAIVMRDPTSQRSRCFGFVTFENIESVDTAQSARPHIIDGKQVDSKRAIPKDDTAPESRVVCNKIFVGGLRRDITEDQLSKYFSQYGSVTECVLMKDKATGGSRGFGFVTFDDTDTVDKVIVARPHSILDSKADVKKAIPKDAVPPKSSQYTPGPYQAGPYGGWQGAYSQGAPQQWNPSAYGYGYGVDPNSGWPAQGAYAAQPAAGNWTDPSAAAASAAPGGFGAYNQQPAYGGGPMRSGAYGSPAAAAPYARR